MEMTLIASPRRSTIQSLVNDALAFWNAGGIDSAAAHDARLCLEEMVTNIVEHGCGAAEDSEIRVALKLNDSSLVMEIHDPGPPFDPTGHAARDIEKHFDERDLGGMGIHLVRHLAKKMTYRREGQTNVLTLVLARSRHEGKEQPCP